MRSKSPAHNELARQGVDAQKGPTDMCAKRADSKKVNTSAETATSLAESWFDVLNGMSNHRYFVEAHQRQRFVARYVEFIDTYGAAVFEQIARKQQGDSSAYANNVGFDSYLAKGARPLADNLRCQNEAMAQRLARFTWVTNSPVASDLVDKAARCPKAEFPERKASYIDGLALTDIQKIELLDQALSSALEERQQAAHR